jgi:hypothetical protein
MTATALQQLTIFIARLVVQVYSGNELSNNVRWLHSLSLLVSQVQAVSFYLVRCVSVLSVIGQNKLSCDWSE